jgi:hypothetical protein
MAARKIWQPKTPYQHNGGGGNTLEQNYLFLKKKKKIKVFLLFCKKYFSVFGFSKTSQNSPNTIFIFEPHKQHYIKIAHTKSIPKFYIFQNSKSKILFYLYQIST